MYYIMFCRKNGKKKSKAVYNAQAGHANSTKNKCGHQKQVQPEGSKKKKGYYLEWIYMYIYFFLKTDIPLDANYADNIAYNM